MLSNSVEAWEISLCYKKTKNNGNNRNGNGNNQINETEPVLSHFHALPRSKILAAMGRCADSITVGLKTLMSIPMIFNRVALVNTSPEIVCHAETQGLGIPLTIHGNTYGCRIKTERFHCRNAGYLHG